MVFNFILDPKLFENISSSDAIVSAINRLTEFGITSDGEEPDDDDDSDEIVTLARKTLVMLE